MKVQDISRENFVYETSSSEAQRQKALCRKDTGNKPGKHRGPANVADPREDAGFYSVVSHCSYRPGFIVERRNIRPLMKKIHS